MSCARHTAKRKGYSCVAQLAERSTVNRMVAGSSPAAGAKKTTSKGVFSKGLKENQLKAFKREHKK